MLDSLDCPNCGAPLNFNDLSAARRCPACGSSIIMADEDEVRPSTTKRDPSVPDATLSEVAALFRAGKRVQATIRYREITGANLKEAQLAIERFAQGEPLQRPER